MNSKRQLKAEKLTMGDLIVVITDAALEVAQDEDMAYQIAGLVFMRLLAISNPETADNMLAGCAGTITKCSHPGPLSDEEKVSGAEAD